MYEAGDILIMPNGEEFKVIYVSGNNTITFRNTRTEKVIVTELEYLKIPKKIVKAN